MKKLLLTLTGAALLSANAMAAEPASCKNIRMGVVSWTDVVATSGMADVLLNGLGYDSKQTSAVQQIIFAGIRDKRLDIFLGYWNRRWTTTSRRSWRPSRSRYSIHPDRKSVV